MPLTVRFSTSDCDCKELKDSSVSRAMAMDRAAFVCSERFHIQNSKVIKTAYQNAPEAKFGHLGVLRRAVQVVDQLLHCQAINAKRYIIVGQVP